ncbi:MAG: glycosyltransferase family 39 protein [Thermoflexales bacterium]|nr:glycosyltransferase family 39 protein [Thermoflexales bacterium]
MLLILIVAAGLRFYRLDAQSLWNDEGNSARLSERTLQSITVGTASDIHPPLYYYVLHFWRALFGHSEFALRALSVACGVILVVLVYLLGVQLFDEPAALAAALIAAVNPFQIYYSQEARMYAMLALLAALSTFYVLRFTFHASGFPLPHASRFTLYALRCMPYVLAAAAGLYTQYTFVFVLLVHNVIVAASLLTQRQDRLRRGMAWAGTQVAVVLLYLPWLPVALSRTGGWGVEPEPYQLSTALMDVARWFAYGHTLPAAQARLGVVMMVLLLIGPFWQVRKEKLGQAAALALWALAPAALMFGLGLYRTAYLKFLLISSPPFCLLLAWGALCHWRNVPDLVDRESLRFLRILSALLVVLMAVPAAWPLPRALSNLYFDPAYARDDYRGMAQFVRSLQDPGDASLRNDAVLLIAPNQWEVFTYYYPDAERVYPLARQRPPDPVAAAAELDEIAARHARLFVLYWGDGEADPHRVYEAWLGAHCYKAGEQWWGRVRLAMYGVPGHDASAPAERTDVRYGEAIALEGYALLTPQAGAGDVIQVALFWQASAPLAERYKVFVHLLDSGGQLVAQVDREPGADLLPTTVWQPGQLVVDRYGVLLPAQAAAGRYTLLVGLYGLDGRRLPITRGGSGDALKLAAVELR